MSEIRYAYGTPEECLEHLNSFWCRPGAGGWRVRFAWLPVTIWDVDGSFVTPTNKRVWLRNVIEVRTLMENWVAYKSHQMALLALSTGKSEG